MWAPPVGREIPAVVDWCRNCTICTGRSCHLCRSLYWEHLGWHRALCLQQGAFRYVREGKCWERDNRRRRRQRGRSRRRRERGRVGVVDLPILQWRSHGRTGGQQPPLSSPWLRHCPQGTSTTGSWYVWPCYINVALVSNKPIPYSCNVTINYMYSTFFEGRFFVSF